MKRRLLVLLFPVLLVAGGAATLQRVDSGVDDFDVNQLNEMIVQKDNLVQKKNSDGKTVYEYSRPDFGDLSSLDGHDALSVLLYYRQMQKIVFLDNTLSMKRSPVDLTDLGYPDAGPVALSYNNGFWLYDPASLNLVRFNRLLQPAEESGNLSQITGYALSPVLLRENGNFVYLLDTTAGLFVFDRYGAYIKRLPYAKIADFQVFHRDILMLRNDTVFALKEPLLLPDTLALPPGSWVKFKRMGERLYLLNKRGELFWE